LVKKNLRRGVRAVAPGASQAALLASELDARLRSRRLPIPAINAIFNTLRYLRSNACWLGTCRTMPFDPSTPVLVVDDHATMVRIIRNLLKQIGFADVDEANDGGTALAKMHEKHYGLVISDWNMEPITGYDLLRQVRADPDLGATAFIMVTAESKTENVIAARRAGANTYIVKPFSGQTLKAKIEAVLADIRTDARADDTLGMS
jgi:two-component system, chemotaxis family, chemotaxis protein CheY